MLLEADETHMEVRKGAKCDFHHRSHFTSVILSVLRCSSSLTSPDAVQINACRVSLALGCDVLRSSENLSLPVNDCHTSCFWARFKRRHACVLQPSLIGDLLRLAAENYPPLRASNLSGPFSKQICGGLCAAGVIVTNAAACRA